MNGNSLKRKIQDPDEEIEINLDLPEPLSKKQTRLLKKGKIDETKKITSKVSSSALKKHKSDNDLYEEESGDVSNEKDESNKGSKKSDFGVWIGNLSFDTTKDDLRRFLAAKSEILNAESITRINLPKNSRNGKIQGFAYVDFTNQDQMIAAIDVSEQVLNGRRLLIKDAKSYDGRPAKVENDPSRILFVGNLSYDTTDSNLESLFQHCGEVVKIRMATFEDSGKCKGFAFVDFKEKESAKKALSDKRCKKLNGRVLRMEYGQDRSKRTTQEKRGNREDHEDEQIQTEETLLHQDDTENTKEPPKKIRTPKPQKFNELKKPGLALATAQRAKVSIVPSSGQKITFD